MKAVIQRVREASVTVDGRVVGQIGSGLAVLLGVVQGDTQAQADILAKKIVELRIFTDEQDKMNRSLLDIGGQALVVSQFTLAADCSHGRRPCFTLAARPEHVRARYESFFGRVQHLCVQAVETGVFGADMAFALVNDGPVTICLDTDEL